MNRWNEMYWIADENVLYMKAIEKMPMLDYFEILNRKIIRARKAEEENRRRRREQQLKK